ncbi:MAG: transglycosylase SLT domain-containing protein [Porticoccaceae bacterium]
MRYRKAHLLITLFAYISLSWLPSASAATPLAEQRGLYQEANRALARQAWGEFQALKARLRDYPLYAYLEYREYAARLDRVAAGTVLDFIAANSDSPLAERLRRLWLDQLRADGRDDDFLAAYRQATASVEQQCHYQLINYRRGERQQSLPAALALWQVGKSQPNACDPLFDRLIADGHIDEEVAWKRYVNALLDHQYRLAAYVERFFTSDAYRQRATNLMAVDRQPATVGNYALLREYSPETLAVLAHGLIHLAQQDAPAALRHWQHYRQHHTFAAGDEKLVTGTLVRNLFAQGHGAAADQLLRDAITLVDARVLDWRLQQAIKAAQWASVVEWSNTLPPAVADSSRWRYWRARALEESAPDSGEIRQIYEQLASERSFYGFLASDKLRRPYTMQHQPVAVPQVQIDELASSPPFVRIAELLYHRDMVAARQEWNFQLHGQPQDSWLTAARLAQRWQWHHQAITSMIQANYWDDVEIRFPLAYREHFDRDAGRARIPLALLLAISRQESSFEPTIVSPAGARGLMQLMPATARETARRHGVAYRNESDLDDPAVNIRLGSHYYRQMLDRFGNNRILATAAYNAGPGRVEGWLRQTAGNLPYDVWIELIPFAETRNYVQNVLAFSMIFAHHLDATEPMLSASEKSRNL